MANDAMTLQPSGTQLSFDGFELDEADHAPAVSGAAPDAASASPDRLQSGRCRSLLPDSDAANDRIRAGRTKDREFTAMSRVFGEHGGMATAEELVYSMRTCLPQPLSIVGRWITQRAAVQLVWRSQTYFPWFQFAHNPISIRRPVADVLLELRDTFDDWDIALWFASGNEWLDHGSPIEAIGHDAAEVVRAARIDRFIAKG